MAEINVSTHSFNAVYDSNNLYIRNENREILMQQIEDGQLMYIPEHVVYEVFGQDNNNHYSDATSTSQNESIPEPDGATISASAVDNGKRRMWSYEETCALIASVEIYQDHLHHVKKRKHVWGNISHDLLSQQIEYSAEVCKKKWLNLIKTYKNCKDMKAKSGRCPTRFLFFKQLDEILGSQPNICSPHSIDPSESVGSPMPSTPEGSFDSEPLGEVNVNEIDKQQGQDDKQKRTPKHKTNLAKLREELKILQTKIQTKTELEERKLSLLEQKIKLDERKVIALEKLAGINPTHQ